MDQNASERPSKRTPADKPAPIAPAWTATPAPARDAQDSDAVTQAVQAASEDTGTASPAPSDTSTPNSTPAVEQQPANSTPAVEQQPASSTPAVEQQGNSSATNPANGQVRLRAGDLDRRRVAAVLHDALGKGQLTITEFDERTSIAWAARYVDELDELTGDLIPARPGLDAAHQPAGAPSQDIRPPASSRITGDGGPTASVAVFSGFERKGVWTVPEKFTAVAIMGGGVIDIRHANFGAQHVTITATALMGGIDIIVPDDVHVDVTGFAFMGGFDDSRKWEGPAKGPDRDAPRVTINGFAMMGGVTVSRKASGPVPRSRNH